MGGQEFHLDTHRSNLETKHWSAGKTGPVREKRETNIEWIKNLPRAELEVGGRERQIVLARTERGERLFIQYPGKEAGRKGDGERPWDFRPRVLLPNGTYGPDLSFGDVWDTLFEVLEPLGEDRIEPARALAALFYRMAFMADHTEVSDFNPQTRLVDGSDNVIDEFNAEGYPGLLRYEPPPDIVEGLTRVLPEWGGNSLKAFLHYNDLMAWNEDCKYYYRDTDGGKDEWDGSRRGRINTLLTHVSIMGLITGDLGLSSLLENFQRSRGVAPVTRDEAEQISDGIIGTN